MFRSIFSRILTTFAVILLVCIALLVFIVSSALYSENQEKEIDVLEITASEIAFLLHDVQQRVGQTTPEVMERPAVVAMLATFAQNADTYTVILQLDGTVVSTISELWNPGDRMLSPETVSSILADPRAYSISDLDGVLPEVRFNGFEVLHNDDGDFLILASSRSGPNYDLANSVTMLMIAVAIWIIFIAMLCVFLVSRRITDPIKHIGDAAKEYASGNFNVRVKLDGRDEVTELARGFNNMAESLARHAESRRIFISNVSHDLRTPMTSIGGFVDGMLDGTIPPEQQPRYLRIISDEVRRLSRLVDALLEVGRLQSSADLSMSEFNLTEKARRILLSLIGKIQAKHIEVEFDAGDEDQFVLANEDTIHQVLYNLVENAVKFTKDGGHIRIWIGPVHGRKAQVRIHNDGESIPAAELPFVFDRFYKSDRSRGLDKNGMGLGLYIVKAILDKHGEPISVESSPEEGTTFTFSLPQRSIGRPRLKNADGSGTAAEPKK